MKVKEAKQKKHYWVETHVGTHDTWATSPEKAISNIRYRLFGGKTGVSTIYWKVRED